MELLSQFKPEISIAPAAHSAGNVEGVAIDTAGFKEVAVLCLSGTNGSGATADVKIQESANGSTGWADISGDAFTQITQANDGSAYSGRIRVTPTRKRYLRAYAVVATDACGLSVVFLLGSGKSLPVAQDNDPAFGT